VELAETDLRPSRILTRQAFTNALTLLGAVSGSTNAVIHVTAIARRAGIQLTLDDFHEAAAQVPVLVDCKPAGSGTMEDFHRAGGVPVLLKALEPLLDPSCSGVSGRSLGECLAETVPPDGWQSTIRNMDKPLDPAGALAALYGSLAPDGAVIKVAAATPSLLRHKGPAIVFESPKDLIERIDDPSLPVNAESVLVLRNAGPVAAGMPEAGCLAIPQRLARQGVRDMVRVTDARMSGTAFGTVVLHCSPEAAVGGPLALVCDGDLIELDVQERRIELCVDPSEFDRRRAALTQPAPPDRGWGSLHARSVLPAHLGADLDFLTPPAAADKRER
jgi:dihydroxy-acid dehydratase